MPSHSHARSPEQALQLPDQGQEAPDSGLVDGLQSLIGNSAVLAMLSGEDQGHHASDAPDIECPHDHGPAAPSPGHGEEEEGHTGALIGAGVGGFMAGPLGALVGAGLGELVERGLDALGSESESSGGQTGLGEEVDALMADSPTLQAAFDQAQANGWTIQYGTAGGGTFADPSTKTITIDPNEKGDAATLANSLAHELGHANFTMEDYIDFGSLTRDEFIRQNTYRHLRDEAEATLSELEVRDELLASDSAIDTGISGATSADKIKLWEEHKAGKLTREQLVDKIADLFATGEFTSNTGENYYDYYSSSYAEHWDNHHP